MSDQKRFSEIAPADPVSNLEAASQLATDLDGP